MNHKKRILVVSHAATRNGATILLLDLLRWLKKHTGYQFDILVNGGGELIDDFRSIGLTTIWRNPDRVFAMFPQGFARRKYESYLLRLLMLRREYDLLYLNTSSVASHASALSHVASRILWHIHEMDYALHNSLGNTDAGRLLPLATRFVAVSTSVRDALVHNFAVPADKIDIAQGFVTVPSFSPEQAYTTRKRIHDQFGWPDHSFVVGGCGALGWRKGTDIFLQIAHWMTKSDTLGNRRFFWIGGGSRDEVLRFEHDIRCLGLQTVCKHLPSSGDVLKYYHAMDAFALTSREDPFPLVMLEAAASCLPIVCFAGSGGGPEFVGNDSGCVVPYLNVAAFVECLEQLRNQPDERRKMGQIGNRKVRTQFTADVLAPKILASIECCLASA
ncbi:MAG: glycosyltransferase family 4 protein [Terriglobales bacterium]